MEDRTKTIGAGAFGAGGQVLVAVDASAQTGKTIAVSAMSALLLDACGGDSPEDHLQKAEESRLGTIEEAREGDPEDAAEERAEMQPELEAAGAAAGTLPR